MNGEGDGREAEGVDAIPAEVVGEALELEPAEDQREGDGDGNQAAPQDHQVGQPAQPAAAQDERVESEHDAEAPAELLEVVPEVAALEEDLPAALPVEGG